MNQLTLLLGEHPVNLSQSQDFEVAWKILEETLPSRLLKFSNTLSQNGLSGKTCQEYFPQITEETFTHSQKVFKQSGMALDGEYLMLNTSDSPKDVKESLLLEIIQETSEVSQRYYLSERACLGILRRADKKGKKLPEKLEQALLQMTGGLRE